MNNVLPYSKIGLTKAEYIVGMFFESKKRAILRIASTLVLASRPGGCPYLPLLPSLSTPLPFAFVGVLPRCPLLPAILSFAAMAARLPLWPAPLPHCTLLAAPLPLLPAPLPSVDCSFSPDVCPSCLYWLLLCLCFFFDSAFNCVNYDY